MFQKSLIFFFCLGFTFVQGQEIALNRIVVQLASHVDMESFIENYHSSNRQNVRISEYETVIKDEDLYVLLLEKDHDNILDIVDRIDNYDAILYSSVDEKVELRKSPNDTQYSDQWNLTRIDATDAWDIATGGQNAIGHDIVIAVVDAGFEFQHEDLIDNIWVNKGEIEDDGIDNDNNGFIDDYYGWDFGTSDDAHVDSEMFHGTGVIGILGARGNNNRGITGINWDVKIMLLSGASFKSEIVQAYEYARDRRALYNQTNGAQGDFVVATNSSFGISNADPDNFMFWCAEYDRMGEEGILSVVSTTNNDSNVDIVGDMPSTCPSEYMISVTNMTNQDVKRQSAGYGATHVDLGAPGQGSPSTDLNNTYSDFGGTSAAAPHVAGTVGLIYNVDCPEFNESYQNDPENTVLSIRDIILDNVDPNTSLEGITKTEGRLNLYQSLLGVEVFCGQGVSQNLAFTKVAADNDTGLFSFEFETNMTGAHALDIFDSSGKRVFYEDLNPGLFGNKRFTINTQNWAQGIYMVHLSNASRQIVEKIAVF